MFLCTFIESLHCKGYWLNEVFLCTFIESFLSELFLKNVCYTLFCFGQGVVDRDTKGLGL